MKFERKHSLKFDNELSSKEIAACVKAYKYEDYILMAKQNEFFVVEEKDYPVGFFALKRSDLTTLVVLGDVAPEQILPSIRKDMEVDFSVTLEHWGKIVNSKWDIKDVDMGMPSVRSIFAGGGPKKQWIR